MANENGSDDETKDLNESESDAAKDFVEILLDDEEKGQGSPQDIVSQLDTIIPGWSDRDNLPSLLSNIDALSKEQRSTLLRPALSHFQTERRKILMYYGCDVACRPSWILCLFISLTIMGAMSQLAKDPSNYLSNLRHGHCPSPLDCPPAIFSGSIVLVLCLCLCFCQYGKEVTPEPDPLKLADFEKKITCIEALLKKPVLRDEARVVPSVPEARRNATSGLEEPLLENAAYAAPQHRIN